MTDCLLDVEFLVLFEGDAAMVPFAEEECAEFGEDAIAEIGNGRRENSQQQLEEAEFGQARDDFADGGRADEEVFPFAIGAAFDEDDGFDAGEFGMGLRELLKRPALFGAVAHPVLVIGELDLVDPAIAEGAFAVEEEEEGMPLGGEGGRFWRLCERAHGRFIFAQSGAGAMSARNGIWERGKFLASGREGSRQEPVDEAGVDEVLHIAPNDEGDEEGDELSLPVVPQEVFHCLYFAGGWRSTGSEVRRW